MSNSEVLRESNGRFRSTNQSSITDELNLSDKGISKRKERNSHLFQGYIRVFFLVGDGSDFIPFSSRSGPLVDTFEKLMKSSFTLGRQTRSRELQEYYRDQKRSKIKSKIARIPLRDPNHPTSDPSKIEVYMHRRLPCIKNRKEEIEPLKTWLRETEKLNALRMDWECAYGICLQAMGTYQSVPGKKGYLSFPALKNAPSSRTLDRPVHHEAEQLHSGPENQSAAMQAPRRIEGNQESSASTGANAQSFPEASDEALKRTDLSNRAPENSMDLQSADFVPSPRSARNFRGAVNFMKIAGSGKVFEVIRRSLDDDDSKFHLMSIPFLIPSLGEPKVPSIVKDSLYYCHLKIFNSKKKGEREEPEKDLREVHDRIQDVLRIYAIRHTTKTNWSFN